MINEMQQSETQSQHFETFKIRTWEHFWIQTFGATCGTGPDAEHVSGVRFEISIHKKSLTMLDQRSI